LRLETLLHRAPPAPGHLPEPVALGGEHLQQLPPARQDGVELLGFLVRQRPNLGPHPLGEEREHAGVDPVGLRQLPGRAREVTHLARVRHHHREPGRGERRHRGELVAARGLQHDTLQRSSDGRAATTSSAFATSTPTYLPDMWPPRSGTRAPPRPRLA
jgi:hypothetical protein